MANQLSNQRETFPLFEGSFSKCVRAGLPHVRHYNKLLAAGRVHRNMEHHTDLHRQQLVVGSAPNGVVTIF